MNEKVQAYSSTEQELTDESRKHESDMATHSSVVVCWTGPTSYNQQLGPVQYATLRQTWLASN